MRIFLRNQASSNRRTRASAPNIQGFPPTVPIVTVRTAGVDPSAVASASAALRRQRNCTGHVETMDRAMTTASTVATVTKDVGEALNGVPIIKAVAGLLVTVIKIADECRVCKDAAKSLSSRLEKTTADIFRRVEDIAPHSEHMDPARRNRILQALAEYFRLVQQIEQHFVALKRYTKWNRVLLRRTVLLGQFVEFERELDRAAQNFQCDLVCGIATDVAIINHQARFEKCGDIGFFFF